MRRKIFLFLILTLFFPVRLSAEIQKVYSKIYSSNNGLVQDVVNSIIQDKNGFLWIATRGGLSRYDGYSFRSYFQEISDNKPPLSNYYNCLYKSSVKRNIIWIGSDKGLYKFNYCKNRFINSRNPFFSKALGNNTGVTSLTEDGFGNLWIGSTSGLIELNLSNNFTKKFKFPAQTSNNTDINYINSLIEAPSNSGIIWAASDLGLFMYDPHKNKIREIDLIKNSRNNFYESINSLAGCGDSLLFAGTGKGFYRINIKSKKGSPRIRIEGFVSVTGLVDIIPSKLNKDVLWIAANNRIYRYNIKFDDITNLQIEFNKPVDLNNLGIQCIYQDSFGILWAGTLNYGLLKISLKRNNFNLLNDFFDKIDFKNSSPVWSVYATKDKILIGSSDRLFILDRKNLKKKQIKSSVFTSNKSVCQVRAISEYKIDKNRFWIGTLGGGFCSYDILNRNVHRYSLSKLKLNPNEKNYVYALLAGPENSLYIGTNGGGFYVFNISDNKIINYPFNKNKSSWVTCFQQINKNKLLIGTYASGLLEFNLKKQKFNDICNHKDLNKILRKLSVLSLLYQPDSIIWIGTHGNGLIKFNIHSGTLSYYSLKNGLPDLTIYAILEDSKHNLWLTTNNGISKFNLNAGVFENYTTKDGLRDNEFNLGAFFKDKNGDFYMGTSAGLNVFTPVKNNLQIFPKTVITQIKVNGNNINVNSFDSCRIKLELPYFKNSISVDFTGLQFLSPFQNNYKYRMIGYDDEWNYESLKREAAYKFLKPGKYLFEVNTCGANGAWGPNGASISLIITPPYWETYWFYGLMAVFLIISVYSLIRIRIRQLLKYEKLRIEERELVRSKIAKDFHDEVGHKATQILLLSDILKKDLKNSSDEILKRINQISENSKILFNEMRTLNWELDPSKDTLYHLAVNLKNFSDQLFDDTEIAFEIKGRLNEFENIKLPLAYRQHLQRIFKEGMHNILKHAKDCKNVILEFSISGDVLSIKLSDDGSGFDELSFEKGNGHSYMKKRAGSINAELIINSQIGTGTVISLKLKLP